MLTNKCRTRATLLDYSGAVVLVCWCQQNCRLYSLQSRKTPCAGSSNDDERACDDWRWQRLAVKKPRRRWQQMQQRMRRLVVFATKVDLGPKTVCDVATTFVRLAFVGKSVKDVSRWIHRCPSCAPCVVFLFPTSGGRAWSRYVWVVPMPPVARLARPRQCTRRAGFGTIV